MLERCDCHDIGQLVVVHAVLRFRPDREVVNFQVQHGDAMREGVGIGSWQNLLEADLSKHVECVVDAFFAPGQEMSVPVQDGDDRRVSSAVGDLFR